MWTIHDSQLNIAKFLQWITTFFFHSTDNIFVHAITILTIYGSPTFSFLSFCFVLLLHAQITVSASTWYGFNEMIITEDCVKFCASNCACLSEIGYTKREFGNLVRKKNETKLTKVWSAQFFSVVFTSFWILKVWKLLSMNQKKNTDIRSCWFTFVILYKIIFTFSSIIRRWNSIILLCVCLLFLILFPKKLSIIWFHNTCGDPDRYLTVTKYRPSCA